MAKNDTCPTWCTGDLHHDEAPDTLGDHSRTFGRLEYTEAADGRELHVPTMTFIDLATAGSPGFELLDPAKLRQLAVDALAAAEWLEARR